MTAHDSRVRALDRIDVERDRQLELWGSTLNTYTGWVTILCEELGEVARAVQNEDKDNLVDELSQVGALCVAWLEQLDKERYNESS